MMKLESRDYVFSFRMAEGEGGSKPSLQIKVEKTLWTFDVIPYVDKFIDHDVWFNEWISVYSSQASSYTLPNTYSINIIMKYQI